jgi:hypothetical protein
MAEDMEQQVDAIFQPKAKVSCGTCFWYAPSRVTPQRMTAPCCRHPNAKRLEETYEGVSVVRIPPDIRNSQNDCQDWRQKTFYSDAQHSAFKQMMFLLAALFLIAWVWGALLP